MPLFEVQARRQSGVPVKLEHLGAPVRAMIARLCLRPGKVVPLEAGVLTTKVEGLK